MTGRPTEALTKENLLRYIREKDHVSFAELEYRFVGFKHEGKDAPLALLAEEHLYLWTGISVAAEAILRNLVESDLVEYQTAPLLVYLIDGSTLIFPIAKRRGKHKNYKTDHWLPVVLRPCGKAEEPAKKPVKPAKRTKRRAA